MNNPLLSIQIPTTPDREQQTKHLIDKIMGDYRSYDTYLSQTDELTEGRYVSSVLPIELLIYVDDKQMTIGEKREKLYGGANGLYSWQIDSDDDVASNAIELIFTAILSGMLYGSDTFYTNNCPDCITFQEHCTINGVHYKSNHSLSYGDWEGDGQKELSDGFHFHRTPFMKSVIKTSIAKSVPVPHIRFGEDHQWAQALKPHLKTEIHIPEDIYLYQHDSTDHNERYGIK